MVDLQALAFIRPHIARRAQRHGGRCRVIGPVTSCPVPFPSRKVLHPLRTSPDRMTVPVKSPEIRGCCWANPQTSRPPSGKSAARRTGWLPRQPCRRRTTSPASRLGHSAATQWKSSLHRFRFRLVNRQPFSVSDPKASDRLSVGPGWRALSGTGHILSVASWQVKGYFRIHRVVHETFGLPTDSVSSSTVHTQRYPQFRSCSAPVGEPATRRPRRGRLSETR